MNDYETLEDAIWYLEMVKDQFSHIEETIKRLKEIKENFIPYNNCSDDWTD